MKKYKQDEKPSMSDNQKNAKKSVLQELKKQASEAMSGKLKGLQKVSVASNSPEGLEKGLDKAKEIIGGDESDGESAPGGSMFDEHAEGESEEDCLSDEDKQLSPEQIDEKINALMKLKEEKQS